MTSDDSEHDNTPLIGRAGIAAGLVFGVAVGGTAATLMPWPAALASFVLAVIVALITLIDARHFIIPDVLSLPAVPLGLIANIAVFHADDWQAGLIESLLGSAVAGGVFLLLREGYFRLRAAEGLGLGDVKLAAAAGAWLGPALLAPACLVAALGGLLAVLIMAVIPGRRLQAGDHIPFGAFIAPSLLLFWLWRLADIVPIW